MAAGTLLSYGAGAIALRVLLAPSPSGLSGLAANWFEPRELTLGRLWAVEGRPVSTNIDRGQRLAAWSGHVDQGGRRGGRDPGQEVTPQR